MLLKSSEKWRITRLMRSFYAMFKGAGGPLTGAKAAKVVASGFLCLGYNRLRI